MNRLLQLLVLAAVALSAAPAAATAPGTAEVLRPEAGTMLAYWIPARRPTPKYPRTAARDGVHGCAMVGFIIEADGRTSTHRALRVYPDERFSDAAIRTLERWRFDPGPANAARQPVYAEHVILFQLALPGETRRLEERNAALRELCGGPGPFDQALESRRDAP